MAHHVPAALQKACAVPLNERLVWSIDDVSKATGLSDRHIAKAVKSGQLAAVRSGRRILVYPEAVKAWLSMPQPIAK